VLKRILIIHCWPVPEKLNAKTSGCKWTQRHYVSVGLDELNSGVIQDVISQISRQPAGTGRNSNRFCPKRNLHIAIDTEAVVREWVLRSVEIKIIF
jgi:hypothetical protein